MAGLPSFWGKVSAPPSAPACAFCWLVLLPLWFDSTLLLLFYSGPLALLILLSGLLARMRLI